MDQIMQFTIGAGGGLFVTWFYITNADLKLTMYDLLLMLPQWCKMTDLDNNDYFIITPQFTLLFSVLVIMVLSVCWYKSEEDDIRKISSETSRLSQYIGEEVMKVGEKDEVLWEVAKTLMDQVECEYTVCASSIAANNETPGQKVGGEVEWATGETSSEDEDATREITGAHLQLMNKESEDEQILKFLQNPLFGGCLENYEEESMLFQLPNENLGKKND